MFVSFFFKSISSLTTSGESKVAEADKVLMFAPFSDRKQGVIGHLFVTNFKISFVPADKSSYPDGDVSFRTLGRVFKYFIADF